MEPLLAKDVMTQTVVTLRPDQPLSDAAKVLAEHNFDGAPVVDERSRLIGIITEYDLVSKGSAIHLPTFQRILQELPVFHGDRSQFAREFQEIATLRVLDVMNPEPLVLPDTATFEDVVKAFRDHHRVNPIPVVDGERKVVGVISRYDILKPLRLAP